MEKEAVRRTSKLLFGSKHRLEIAAAVAAAPDDRVYGRAIATSTGVADNQVWSELRRMEDANLLYAFQRRTTSRKCSLESAKRVLGPRMGDGW